MSKFSGRKGERKRRKRRDVGRAYDSALRSSKLVVPCIRKICPIKERESASVLGL